MVSVVGPSSTVLSHPLRCLRGVVFDMDGTLTVPVINFAQMYKEVLGENHPRILSRSPVDILLEIADWSPDKQEAAYEVIARHESEARERLQIMPGALELCAFLDAKKLRRGLITRNVKASVDLLHSRLGITKFYPAISREFCPRKPDPAPLLHICRAWEVSPADVMMVGDSAKDDIVCGNGAGAITCLLDESGRYDLSTLPQEQQPAFKVKSLHEVESLLKSSFDLMP